jgi:hypothetical protein
MMRVRRASMNGVLTLLTSAATAHAECAWVLWDVESSLGSNAPTRWTVVAASDSLIACEQVADDKRKAPWNQPEDGSTMLVRFGKARGVLGFVERNRPEVGAGMFGGRLIL